MTLNKTYATKKKDIVRSWHLVDAKDQILGRMTTQIAQLLQGKDKPYYSRHLDCGDYVVVVNASKVKLTGKKKAKQKTYYRHSGYPGALKQITFEKQMEKDPRKVVLWAAKNMLPKNKLRNDRLARLKIFSGSEHDYQDKFSKKGKNGKK